LICGPTGCGKTTTLHSALELIKSGQRNIVTVEDPVDYRTNWVDEVQISEAKGPTLPVALRSVLLRDPDVITVGEIRDAETAEVAVKAALTGHLVLSTLHAADSADAIVRLVDMGIEPYRVAASLIGVLAQRLVRRVCVKCRTAYCPDPELLQTVGCSRDGARRFVRGEGCRACRGTGFAGRSGIFELFAVDEVARRLISHRSDTMTLRARLCEQGCRTLSEEGMRAAEECVTSLDEVLRVTALEESADRTEFGASETLRDGIQ
ncbi:MAG: type II secretion system protein GspE, partial [Planctomycetes bacterium]|nr:type II secretion system protein GspE [Planctomycetota bacterium]